jgi:hypothetical protein
VHLSGRSSIAEQTGTRNFPDSGDGNSDDFPGIDELLSGII